MRKVRYLKLACIIIPLVVFGVVVSWLGSFLILLYIVSASIGSSSKEREG